MWKNGPTLPFQRGVCGGDGEVADASCGEELDEAAAPGPGANNRRRGRPKPRRERCIRARRRAQDRERRGGGQAALVGTATDG